MHDKTNKLNCAHSEDSDRIGRASASAQSDQSSLSAVWVAKDANFFHADNDDWPDSVVTQAGLSLRWAHKSFCCPAALMLETYNVVHVVVPPIISWMFFLGCLSTFTYVKVTVVLACHHAEKKNIHLSLFFSAEGVGERRGCSGDETAKTRSRIWQQTSVQGRDFRYQQKIQLQHFHLFFAGTAAGTVLTTTEKWFHSERHPFYMHFVLIGDR